MRGARQREPMSAHTRKILDDVYDFIRAYDDTHGMPPSQREIAKGCFIAQSSVTHYLDLLAVQGRIDRIRGVFNKRVMRGHMINGR